MEKGETAAEEERTGLHHRRDAVVEKLGDPNRPVRVRAMERVDPFVRRQIFERSPKQFCGLHGKKKIMSRPPFLDGEVANEGHTWRSRTHHRLRGMVPRPSPSIFHPHFKRLDHLLKPSDRTVQGIVHPFMLVMLFQEQGGGGMADEVVLRRGEAGEIGRRWRRRRTGGGGREWARDGSGLGCGGGGGRDSIPVARIVRMSCRR